MRDVIFCLMIKKHRLVTDGRTDIQTDRHMAIAYTAVAERRAEKKPEHDRRNYAVDRRGL